MKVEVVGNNLVITIPIAQDPQPSASGKTLIVATSGGNKETDVLVQGKKVVVGLNAYVKK